MSDQSHQKSADQLGQAKLKGSTLKAFPFYCLAVELNALPDHYKLERDMLGPDAKVADQVRVSRQGQRHGEVLQGTG